LNKHKILLTTFSGWPGACTAFRHIAKLTGFSFSFLDEMLCGTKYSDLKGHFTKVSTTLKAAIQFYTLKNFLNYDYIVIGGYTKEIELLIKRLKNKGKKVYIHWFSTPGQSEMSKGELYSMHRILELLNNYTIDALFVNRRAYKALEPIPRMILLPHPICTELITTNRKVTKLPGYNIDLFLPFRPGKNILTQVLAVRKVDKNVSIHSNVDNQIILALIKYLDVKFTKYYWLKSNEYYNLISRMTLSLQVTHTESFNYAVAERMCLGIPPLATFNIYFLSKDKFLQKHLCVDAPDSVDSIAKKLKTILYEPTLREELSSACIERIMSVAGENNQEMLQIVAELFK